MIARTEPPDSKGRSTCYLHPQERMDRGPPILGSSRQFALVYGTYLDNAGGGT